MVNIYGTEQDIENQKIALQATVFPTYHDLI